MMLLVLLLVNPIIFPETRQLICLTQTDGLFKRETHFVLRITRESRIRFQEAKTVKENPTFHIQVVLILTTCACLRTFPFEARNTRTCFFYCVFTGYNTNKLFHGKFRMFYNLTPQYGGVYSVEWSSRDIREN